MMMSQWVDNSLLISASSVDEGDSCNPTAAADDDVDDDGTAAAGP